jgi:hypothetical protein
MADFLTTKSSLIKLDTAQFVGGSGLLDDTTTDVQKALTAINTALDYATTEFSGVMSNTDKIKLDDIEPGAQVNDINTTTQGNTFNGINQLVKLNGTGKLPILDGSNLTNVNSSLGSINTLTDVDTNTISPINGDSLVWDGINWVPGLVSGGGISNSTVSVLPAPTLLLFNKIVFVIGDKSYICTSNLVTPLLDSDCFWVQT